MIRYYCDRCGGETGTVVDRVQVSRRTINLEGVDRRMERGAPGAKVVHRDLCAKCADEVEPATFNLLVEIKELAK